MGKLAGFWKKIKKGISKALDVSGKALQKLSDTNLISLMSNAIPGGELLAKPLNTVAEKVGTTLTKFSDAMDGEINKKQLGQYLNEEYKHSAVLGPYNAVKTMVDATKKAKKNGQTVAEGLINGGKTLLNDLWDYNKEILM